MNKILVTAGCLLAAILLWIIVPEQEHVEVTEWGISMQLVKKTSLFPDVRQPRFGVNKNGTVLLAPVHKMVENEHLNLRVFYGLNAKVHVFDMKTGEKVMTGWAHGRNVESVWFRLDEDLQHDRYLLISRYMGSYSSIPAKNDTIAVFEEKNGEICLVKSNN